jgi:fructose transport system substrate-binding protein
MLHIPSMSPWRRRFALAAVGVLAASTMAACGGSDDTSSDSGSDNGGSSGDSVAVTLITKDSVNPFFVAMQEGAKTAGEANGVDITIASGAEDGDEQGQIEAIDAAIAAGQQGILITPNGPAVNPKIKEARDAGLFVIALDTPPDPPETVDITFATDNFEAGELIGQWTKTQLKGKKATIAMLDLFTDKVVSVDYNRDQGFLTGLGVDVKDPQVNGDEAPTGSYGDGDYEIVCNEQSNGNEADGQAGMENCLAKNPNINVIYTINEPAAYGAVKAVEAAGKTQDDVLVVSVDGGCQGVEAVKKGVIDATSQQYPLRMAEEGVKAIKEIATSGEKPANSEGLDFFNTGVALITDTPAQGVDSIDTAAGLEICWG